MGKKLLVVLLVVVIVAVGGVVGLGLLGGQVEAALAVVSVVRTDFESQRPGGAFAPTVDGDVLSRGDELRTDTNGRGYLTFFDGSTVEVEPDARVAVSELRSESDGTAVIRIEQTLGTTWLNVAKLANPNSRFEIKTPSVTASVRGTGFHTFVQRNGATTIRVRTGTVNVAGSGGQQTVTADFEVTAPPNQPPPAPTRTPPGAVVRFSSTPATDIIVTDPRGLTCGSGRAESPGCSEGSVILPEPPGGAYSVTVGHRTTGEIAAPVTLRLEALFGETVLDTKTLQRQFAPGERVRTTFALTLDSQGRPSVGALTPFEVLSASVCGLETSGRIFAGGTLSERQRALSQFASTNKNQPVAFVVTQADVAAAAGQALANQPLTDVSVTIGPAGLRFRATAAILPVSTLLSAGVQNGQLALRVRALSLPGPVADQIRPRLEEGLASVGRGLALTAQRVSLREGCFAVIGLTK